MGLIGHLARGAAAGVAGTLAVRAMREWSGEHVPQTLPPMRGDPAKAVLERATSGGAEPGRAGLPARIEPAVEQALPLAYGAAAGLLYSVLRPGGGEVIRDGTLLGVATWAAGYLGWLQDMDLLPPLEQQTPAEIAGPVVRHALFGIVTAGVFRVLDA